MSNTYAVAYSVSHIDELVAEQNYRIKKCLELRRLTADRSLERQLENLSKKESRPHRVALSEWLSHRGEFETTYKRLGKLVLESEDNGEVIF